MVAFMGEFSLIHWLVVAVIGLGFCVIVVFIVLRALRGGSNDDTPTTKCPFCAEEIQATAIKCKHCGEFLDQDRKGSR
jgi:hypothetical protein